MNVEELIKALESRAIDKRKTVVVETRRSGLIEVDGMRYGHDGLIVLTLWKPRSSQ